MESLILYSVEEDTSVNVNNLTEKLYIECLIETVHNYYCFAQQVGILKNLFKICKSLYIRESDTHPDVIICLAHYVYFDTSNRRPFLPAEIYDQLEVRPIVINVCESVYDYVRDYCCKYVENNRDELESDNVKTVHREVFETMRKDTWEGCFTFFHPPRVVSDIGIRNIQFGDMHATYCASGKEEVFWSRLAALAGKSYIFSLNVMLYAYVNEQPWFETLDNAGAFRLKEYALRDCLKGYSDHCKKRDFVEGRRETSIFIENHNLFGALQPPVEGWDPVDQTRLLATSETIEHGIKGSEDVTFEYIAQSTLLYPAKPIRHDRPHSTFKEFILYGDWERSGASSLGRVSWRYTDQYDSSWNKEGKFKARKNFVLDVMHVDDLVAGCLEKDFFPDNVALIKSELAKIRIAVASPLEAYLLESFILYWANHFYLSWEGSTLEEDTEQEYERNFDQWIRMVHGEFVLPYDFENFDHQIATSEVLAITEICHFVAASNFGDRGSPEFKKARSITVRSIQEAVLHDPPGFGRNVHKVTNGLMSGMRATSIIGNAFNLCAYRWSQKILLDTFGVKDWNINVEVRGDDLRLTSKNQFLLMLTYYVYKALGFKANPAKFGLCKGRGDFLRLDCVAKEGIVGLPARTTPSVTQRKPWKAAAWIGENRLVTVCENMFNIARRLPVPAVSDGFRRPFDIMTNVILSRWSEAVKISSDYLNTPRLAGGLGLGQWSQNRVISHRGNKIPVAMFEELDIHLEIDNKVTFNREEQYINKYQRYNMMLSQSELNQLIKHDILAKVASDDIPGLIDQVRFHYRRYIRGVKFRNISSKVVKNMQGVALGVEHLLEKLTTMSPTQDSLKMMDLLADNKSKQPFGLYGSRLEEIRDKLRIGRLRKETTRKAVETVPEFMKNCTALEKRLKLKRHVAIDWLTEGLTLDYAIEVHPAVISRLSKIAASYVEYLSPWIPNSDSFTVLWNIISRKTIDAFNQSLLCKGFFSF